MGTYYVVQTYSVGSNRRLQADTPREAKSADEAKRLAQRLAETKMGVVAFSRSGSVETGDWDDAVVLYREGNFPQEDADALALAS